MKDLKDWTFSKSCSSPGPTDRNDCSCCSRCPENQIPGTWWSCRRWRYSSESKYMIEESAPKLFPQLCLYKFYEPEEATQVGLLILSIGESIIYVLSASLFLSSQSYEKWRDSLPDTQWIQDLFPSTEKVDSFRSSLANFSTKFRESLDNIDIGKITFRYFKFESKFEFFR